MRLAHFTCDRQAGNKHATEECTRRERIARVDEREDYHSIRLSCLFYPRDPQSHTSDSFCQQGENEELLTG